MLNFLKINIEIMFYFIWLKIIFHKKLLFKN
jgi:hypothetical protein